MSTTIQNLVTMVTWHPGFVYSARGNARKHNKRNHQMQNKRKYESL